MLYRWRARSDVFEKVSPACILEFLSCIILSRLKMKYLYFYIWLLEELLTSMETFHSIKKVFLIVEKVL